MNILLFIFFLILFMFCVIYNNKYSHLLLLKFDITFKDIKNV